MDQLVSHNLVQYGVPQAITRLPPPYCALMVISTLRCDCLSRGCVQGIVRLFTSFPQCNILHAKAALAQHATPNPNPKAALVQHATPNPNPKAALAHHATLGPACNTESRHPPSLFPFLPVAIRFGAYGQARFRAGGAAGASGLVGIKSSCTHRGDPEAKSKIGIRSSLESVSQPATTLLLKQRNCCC